MAFRRKVFVFLAGLFAAAPAPAAEVVTIEPRDGVTLRMLIEVPAGARDLAMLFPGGAGKARIEDDGAIRGTKGNFLTRSRDRFAENGIAWALIDAPSDRMDKQGLTFDYRMTEEHAGDIKAAIAKLREAHPGLRVWVVGTSRGSTSAANAAATLKSGGPDGAVLTASVGVSNRHGGNILEFELEKITIPVLVVHHEEDTCGVTPVSGARDIKARLTGTKAAELMVFTGGDSGSGKACGAQSHHGFLGIEDQVVAAIAAWIRKN